MPEGPEVFYYAQKLHKIARNTVLHSIQLVAGPYKTNSKPKYSYFRRQTTQYKPHTVSKVYSHGKYIIFVLKGSQYSVLISHLGMEGSWREVPDQNHLLTLTFHEQKNKSIKEMYFCDSRRFGTFSLLTKSEFDKVKNKFGLDVLSRYTVSEFIHQLNKGKNRKLCLVLVDPSLFGGVGNYLRADIMYVAGLSPHRTITSLSRPDKLKLYQSLRQITKESVDALLSVQEQPGSIIHRTTTYEYKIYGKKQDSFGNPVETFEDSKKRTVHWCPLIQK
jgi:formamidopyrimidine-DNA glycosylase